MIFSGVLYKYKINKLQPDLSQIMPLKLTITSTITDTESDLSSNNTAFIVKNYSKKFLCFIIFL
jgi:hypothetical protein